MSEAVPGERVEDKSLGELVALASSSVSDLIRAEMDLAKLELKADAKKAAVSSVMFTVAAVMIGLIVLQLSFAFAYGLIAMGIWRWAAFGIVAAACFVLAVILILIGVLRIRKIEKAQRTRKTLKDDFNALRRRGGSDDPELTA
ncbi:MULTISPECIES: phage holin family protein [unclassified Actinomadura]|uniref:phage holin family protein n=1 Tax=unclassified Actinomadura TaxID=2626254 RepID=UPI0011ECDF1F|nr:phage holin family protein [Actinomadura sp. K4S16]